MFLYTSKEKSPIAELIEHSQTDSDLLCGLKRLDQTGELKAIVGRALQQSPEAINQIISTSEFLEKHSIIDLRVVRNTRFAVSIRLFLLNDRIDIDNHFISANDVFMYFIGDGFCELRVFRFEKSEDPHVFNPHRARLSDQTLTFRGGDHIKITGGTDGFYISRCSNLIILEVSSFEHEPIIYNFDTASGVITHATSADVSSSRMLAIMDVLDNIGDADSIEVLLNIVHSHPHHYVRWRAVECLSALDYPQIAALLQTLQYDSHPEIRQAAIKTIHLHLESEHG